MIGNGGAEGGDGAGRDEQVEVRGAQLNGPLGVDLARQAAIQVG